MSYEDDDGDDGDGYDEPTPTTGGFDLSPCACCGRNFNPVSLVKHEKICAKTIEKAKKRGVFNVSKQRIQAMGLNPAAVAAAQVKNDKALEKSEAKKAMWRQKHETFVKTIREARMVQGVLQSGGSLADLPPPPRDEHPDYVSCPHCTRRFDETVAQRHIPFCATQAKRITPKKAVDPATLKRTQYKPPLPRPGSASKPVPVASLRASGTSSQTSVQAKGGRPPANAGATSRPPPTATAATPRQQQPTPPLSRKPPIAAPAQARRASSIAQNDREQLRTPQNDREPPRTQMGRETPTYSNGFNFRTGNPAPVERVPSAGFRFGF